MVTYKTVYFVNKIYHTRPEDRREETMPEMTLPFCMAPPPVYTGCSHVVPELRSLVMPLFFHSFRAQDGHND